MWFQCYLDAGTLISRLCSSRWDGSSEKTAEHNHLHKLLIAFFIYFFGVSSKYPIKASVFGGAKIAHEKTAHRWNCLSSWERDTWDHRVLRGAAVWTVKSMFFWTKCVEERSKFEPTSLLHVEEVFAGLLHRPTDWSLHLLDPQVSIHTIPNVGTVAFHFLQQFCSSCFIMPQIQLHTETDKYVVCLKRMD